MSVKLSTEQRAELMDIYPKVYRGVADSVNTTMRMVRLHNEVYGTRYKERTSCKSCLSGILRKIKQLYECI